MNPTAPALLASAAVALPDGHDGADGGIVALNRGNQFKTVHHAGHAHIGQHQANVIMLCQNAQSFGAVLGVMHGKARILQRGDGGHADEDFILHHQYRLLRFIAVHAGIMRHGHEWFRFSLKFKCLRKIGARHLLDLARNRVKGRQTHVAIIMVQADRSPVPFVRDHGADA
jgi:hypothetical protein